MKILKIFLLILTTSLFYAGASAQTCANAYYYGIGGYSMSFTDTIATCCGCGFTPVRANTIWEFGDSSASDTGQTVTHTYASSGTYNVVVTKYNSTFTSSMDSTHVVTVGNLPPQPNCASFNSSVSVNKVNFTNTSSCTTQTRYSWDFGDGNNGTGSNVSHTYSSTGSYTVTLTVSNSSTTIDTTTNIVVISSVPQSCASFTHSKVYNVVSFSNTSNCTGAVSYNWSFGDNSYGTGTSPTHTYASPGYYNVNLVVLDSGNNVIDTALNVVTISMPPSACRALFTFSQARDSSGNLVPGHVVITDMSTGGNPASALTYYWDFGDSTSSTSNNPSHTYTGNGPYLLCLTITDSNCTSTYCDTLSVDSNGNVKSAEGFTIHVGKYNAPAVPDGITELHDANFEIYPNPVSDILIISNITNKKDLSISVINTSGQIVLNKRITSVSEKIELDMSSINSGLHFIIISSDNNDVETFKILVE